MASYGKSNKKSFNKLIQKTFKVENSIKPDILIVINYFICKKLVVVMSMRRCRSEKRSRSCSGWNCVLTFNTVPFLWNMLRPSTIGNLQLIFILHILTRWNWIIGKWNDCWHSFEHECPVHILFHPTHWFVWYKEPLMNPSICHTPTMKCLIFCSKML